MEESVLEHRVKLLEEQLDRNISAHKEFFDRIETLEHGRKLQEQLQEYFDGRYVKVEDCEEKHNDETNKIDGLKEEFAKLREEVRVDRAKTNTRLNILIAILSTLAVPIVGVCVKLIFG